jgi:dienelactone hydrolase
MKKIYIAVFIIFVISAVLFISSLFYLDREKHKVYTFNVTVDGRETGSIKVDKFVTDENILYRSRAATPFEPFFTESKERLILDRDFTLVSYFKECSGPGAADTLSVRNTADRISFVGTSCSEFAYLSDLPVKHRTFVFDAHSPLTYLPLLDNYDFQIGRAQAFSVVTFASPLLPPMKGLLTLTSIRDDYIKIAKRKIKVEVMLVRMKNAPQGILYVAKYGRGLIALELPDAKIKITRTVSPKDLKAQVSAPAAGCAQEEVKIAGKKASLAGTVTAPYDAALKPAVLLIGEAENSDREERGLFTSIAGALAKNGFLTLRYDARGIAASGGDSRAVTDNELADDARAAFKYLAGRKDVDASRISVLGHGNGALYAAKIAAEDKSVKNVVIISPQMASYGTTDLDFDILNQMAAKNKWDEQYLKLAIKSRIETVDKVKGSKGDWVSVLKTRCFAGKLREELEAKPADVIRAVECSVLIMQGKEDELTSSKDAANLDKALEDSQNKDHKLIYYGYLGHFMGKRTDDGVHRAYYETDPAVLDTLVKWLKERS